MDKENQKEEKKIGLGRVRGEGAGPRGHCICPSCGTKVPHKAGIPCNQINCPKCNTKMIR